MRDIHIGDRSLATGPPYLIAEAGVNHNGDLSRAHELVDIAARAGADAVKFQAFEARTLARSDAPSAGYQQSDDQYGMLAGLELEGSDFAELREHAGEADIHFLCTPFSVEAAHFLVDHLGVPAVKTSSGDLTFASLLRYLATVGVPILVGR